MINSLTHIPGARRRAELLEIVETVAMQRVTSHTRRQAHEYYEYGICDVWVLARVCAAMGYVIERVSGAAKSPSMFSGATSALFFSTRVPTDAECLRVCGARARCLVPIVDGVVHDQVAQQAELASLGRTLIYRLRPKVESS